MKVTREKPEILRFIYRQESGDPHYGSCLWAIFDLDPGRGMLNIQSDCGNYAYRWPERGNEFLRLMTGIDKGYLLKKLCGKPKEVDEEATIERVKEYLQDAEYYEDEDLNRRKIERGIERLEAKFEDFNISEEGFAAYMLDEWNDENNMQMCDIRELVQTSYGAHQKRIADIFIGHIEPEIRRAILEGVYHGTEDED